MYEDELYCYLETTGQNWNVGQLPEEYELADANITPVYKRPLLQIKFKTRYKYNSRGVFVNVNATVTNIGSEDAKNTKIYIALQAENVSRVWDDIKSESLNILPESEYNYRVTDLYAPAGKKFRVYVRAYGDNTISDEAIGKWRTLG